MSPHQTVFLHQALDFLDIKAQQWYLDATFGAGGHTQEILHRGGQVIAFEYDTDSYQAGLITFQSALTTGNLHLFNLNFDHLSAHLPTLNFLPNPAPFAGIIFDLGTSTDQLMTGDKGLSVYQDGPLDMRLDQNLGVTAQDLLLALSEKQLAQSFFEIGGEVESRRIAKAIITYREKKGSSAFARSQELSLLIAQTKKSRSHLHPATKVFQALRILVNDETGNLERTLPQAFQTLQKNGRLVVIAFHEGEDRPVKKFFQQQAADQKALLITKKPLVPDSQELDNHRSRSAKMRVLEKIV